MQVRLRIRRYDPERDSAPHLETYTVEADPSDPRLVVTARGAGYRFDGEVVTR